MRNARGRRVTGKPGAKPMRPNGARRPARIAAAGGTPAAAAALAPFKSAPTEPIYLWALGISAPGWTMNLGRAVIAAPWGTRMYSDAAGDDSLVVIDGLAKVTGAEMRRACNELLCVDEMLEHAIGQLMSAFTSVSEEARRHRQEIVRAAEVAPATHAAQRLRAKAQRVANDVNGAVTALQFRDVVGQKLGHVRSELEALERMMQRIRVVSAPEPGLVQPPVQAQLATRVHGLLQELDRVQALSPAPQALMHAGEVDLF